ncbi:hypothetical protein MTO96_016864 [Rhipicephalus appendiculatus]
MRSRVPGGFPATSPVTWGGNRRLLTCVEYTAVSPLHDQPKRRLETQLSLRLLSQRHDAPFYSISPKRDSATGTVNADEERRSGAPSGSNSACARRRRTGPCDR